MDLDHALLLHAIDDVPVSPPRIQPRQAALPAPTGTPRAPLSRRPAPRASVQPAKPQPEVPGLAVTTPLEAPNRYANRLRRLRQLAGQVYVEPALPPEVEDLTALVRRGALPSPRVLPSVIGAELAIEAAEVPSLVLDVSPLESELHFDESELRPPRPWWLQRRALAGAGVVAALGIAALVVVTLGGRGESASPEPTPGVVVTAQPVAAPQQAAAPTARDTSAPREVASPAPEERIDFVLRIPRSRASRPWAHRRRIRRASGVNVDALLLAGQRRTRARRAARPRPRPAVLTAQVDVDALLTAGARPRSSQRPRRVKQGPQTRIPAWAR